MRVLSLIGTALNEGTARDTSLSHDVHEMTALGQDQPDERAARYEGRRADLVRRPAEVARGAP
ncbi:hypothetical protein ACFY7Z_00980 [Streptomyces sp. NPDC012623]|uniref:hypothetical protein n=1 Tax=unclassified Streptomyces TaxID=2593676 RepID=UPI00367B8BB5